LAFVGGPHPLKLLRHPDRGHPAASGAGLPIQIGAHHFELAADVVLAESHHRDVVLRSEVGHRLAEALTELSEQRWRRERIAQMIGQKRHHLGAGLQFRHVAIQINPIRALDIQGHMPVQNLGHGHDPLRHDDHLDTEHAPAAAPPRPPGIRGAAATPEDSVGPLATISATAVDQVKPATHLGGPRLASLLLQP